ncbi:Alpha/Beta hydrolase protein [Absidia repens]|uniref:Alpha/Beta hydrolase protein n=1 Tax=Absidia repens TaxID=90262 RepID=A0A1X2I832_9FUNG|nr:Alpha/Beta hydrolase protein [Absidia repens]
MPAKKPSMLSTAKWLTPIITSTTYSHFIEGPPAKSWTLKYNLMMAIIKAYTSPMMSSHASTTVKSEASTRRTIEKIQRAVNQRTQPLSKHCTEAEFTIGTEWREKGGAILEHALDLDDGDDLNTSWAWQDDRMTAEPLKASWIQPSSSSSTSNKKTLLYFHGGAYFLGTYKMYRPLLSQLALKSGPGGARVLAVDYRLAPQHPFPCALEDALAAYLYLIAPPPEAPFAPVAPSDIVIAGDSAGGGLTMALLLTIRDHGLPAPGGAIPISPWVDLTHALPSCASNELTDYLPPSTSTMAKWANGKQVHHYVPNRLLRHPLVSPVHDPRQWQDLPPLLIQTGNMEQLRDESIYVSLMATNNNNQNGQGAGAATTRVVLDLYDDMPHVFQMLLPTPAVRRSIDTMAHFLNDPSSLTTAGAGAGGLLTVRAVAADGQAQDVTQAMIDKHQGPCGKIGCNA